MHHRYEFMLYDQPRGGVVVQRWLYTTAPADEVLKRVGSSTFKTYKTLAQLTHSAQQFNNESNSGQLTITAPRPFAISALLLNGYPYGALKVQIAEVDDGAVFTTYRGRIRSCSFEPLTSKLLCTNGNEALQRLGLRLVAGRQCQWNLFGEACGLIESDNRRYATVSSVSADGLTIGLTYSSGPAWADGEPNAGKFSAGQQVRMVVSSTAAGVKLLSAIPGLTVGQLVAVTRGCARTRAACEALGNIRNFSGFDGIPHPKNVFQEGAK